MTDRIGAAVLLLGASFVCFTPTTPAPACCPAPPSGKPVVNADQTVLIVWDPATKTQHFIRRASFKSEAEDFGFLVPTPAEPELSESGNEAFPFLQKLTEPETQQVPRPNTGVGCGCSAVSLRSGVAPQAEVRVLQEKENVAGFKAAVLEAASADALVKWLGENGYAFSPEVRAWAKPYVEGGWKITALKVASKDGESNPSVTASALRLTFKTDRPLFPYREPDSTAAAQALGAKNRLLRIYFVADARYQGELTKDVAWTGKVAWANKLSAEDRKQALELLKLTDAGPAEWWLTEFEDPWPYQLAPADLYFSRDGKQAPVKRPPIIRYVSTPFPVEVTGLAAVAVIALPPLLRRVRRRQA